MKKVYAIVINGISTGTAYTDFEEARKAVEGFYKGAPIRPDEAFEIMPSLSVCIQTLRLI